VQSKRRKLLQDMARNMELELASADRGRVKLMRAMLDEGPLAQTSTWYNTDSNLQHAVEHALRIKQAIFEVEERLEASSVMHLMGAADLPALRTIGNSVFSGFGRCVTACNVKLCVKC
jgi:hypothetical protein